MAGYRRRYTFEIIYIYIYIYMHFANIEDVRLTNIQGECFTVCDAGGGTVVGHGLTTQS
jgi:hypothetical protein